MILKKPCETPSRLNLAHPHAQGLVASYLFNGQGHKVFDYTCNQNELDVVGASYTADGLQFDANGEYAFFDNTKQVVNSEVGTIVIKYMSNSVFSDSVDRGIFSKWGRINVEGSFIFHKTSANTIYAGFVDDVGKHSVLIPSSDFPNWQTGNQISMQWDINSVIYDSKKIAFNVDGEYKTPVYSENSTSWNPFTISNILYVGNDAQNSNKFVNGTIEHLYIYNKVLSENTLKSIYQDPYAMYDVYSNIIFSFFFSVSVPLVITTQPENTTVAKETDASFSVEATGSGVLTYQWYRNSELQAGETSSTYSFTTTLSNNNDSIYCIVSDDNSSLQSDTVFLTVVSCVMNTNADALEEKDYPIPQKIEYKEDYEK